MAAKNDAIFQLIDDIVTNNNLTKEEVSSILQYSLAKAFTKEFSDKVVDIFLDFDNHVLKISEKLKVVDDQYFEDEGNDDSEIALEEARKFQPNIQIGDELLREIDPKSFDTSMTRTALQLFKQKVSEIVNQKIYEQWKDKKGTIISGKVEMTDPIKKFSFVQLDNTKGFVSALDKIPGEKLETGKVYKFYVKDVREQTKGWPIILSRVDVGFVKNLVRLEVPEVAQDIITIEAAARIPGFKTKIAVRSNNSSVDPIATCIGQRKSRVEAICHEIGGNEKVEFLKYYDDPIKFIASACLPTKIIGVEIVSKNEKSATIVCPNEALSLVIGIKGKNISLIHNLTGWNLDVKGYSEAQREGVNYTPLETSFYDRTRNSKTYITQFASTQEILKNLEQASSYEEIEKTFDLKNNEMIGELNTNIDVSQIERVNRNSQKQLNSGKKETAPSATAIVTKTNEAKKTEAVRKVEEEVAIAQPKKTSKIDYSKLRSESSVNLDSLEAMLNNAAKPSTPKSKYRSNFRKNNKFYEENDNKEKKTNVLDEFDDVTADYLQNQDEGEFIDDEEDNNYDDYDSDEFES